tara:strand:- start:73 stop:279 length:207 start_codon:yes stop_codon:yes gene_type:complete
MKEDNDERLNKIESKYLFQEDSIERLSHELRTQQVEIQKLKDEIKLLKESETERASKEDTGEEKPPHY